jgi:hypothetical protein
MLRRVLLGWLTALIVARPLLPGEDPGLLLPTTGTAGLLLTLSWLFAAVGWAAWRAWSGQATWRVGWVEAGLLGVAVSGFLGADTVAWYTHPAWLVAWEWAVLLVIFILVRQLFRSEMEQRALLAAFLATAVCLSAQAVYQVSYPLAAARTIDPTLADLYRLNDSFFELAVGDPVSSAGSATFARPGTFACYLVLVLPALVIGWFLTGQSEKRSVWRLVFTASCCLAACLALGLTRWWPALIALLLVNAGFLGAGAGHLSRRSVVLGCLASLTTTVALALVVVPGPFRRLLRDQLESAGASLAMIGDHFFLGVGPGNFGRHYPAYLLTASAPRLADPGNFLLEALATGGIVTLAPLLVALGAFFVRVWPEWRVNWCYSPPYSTPSEGREGAASDAGKPTWEIYIGGLVGLTLAFLLQASSLPPAEVVHLAAVSSGRSLVWLGAFAVLLGVPWTQRWRVVAGSAGVLAALLCLVVTGGFFAPSLGQPLWVMAALTLLAVPEGRERSWSLGQAGMLVPVPLLGVAALLYLLVVYLPASISGSQLASARLAYPPWREAIEPRCRDALDLAAEAAPPEKPAGRPSAALRKAAVEVALAQTFLEKNILKPLGEAVANAPDDVRPRVELAFWHGKAWELHARLGRVPGSATQVPRLGETMRKDMDLAMAQLQQAQPLDPRGSPAFWLAYQLRLRFTGTPGIKPEEIPRLHTYAANHLRVLVGYDPTNPYLRYRLAEVLQQVDNPEMKEMWPQEAEHALSLDRHAGSSPRRLTVVERRRLETWLKAPAKEK